MIPLTRFRRKALPLAAVLALASVTGSGRAASGDAASSSGRAAQSGSAVASGGNSAPPTAVTKPPAQAVTKPAVTKPSPPTPANLEALPASAYTGILGKKIIGPDGKELGLVVDVVVDAQGGPHAAVIDFGGFLGVGSRKIAVDWRLLKLTPGAPDWKISLNISRDEIQGAPEFKPDAASGQMVGPPPQGPPSHDVDR
ncbi:MAG TPA: PRC-barrel domain-containing protein [Stellaceae bacterium]|jgi:hypothetical protein|nr:PRC-barrel domain-containing protein [Stellaceae bacterium]